MSKLRIFCDQVLLPCRAEMRFFFIIRDIRQDTAEEKLFRGGFYCRQMGICRRSYTCIYFIDYHFTLDQMHQKIGHAT